MSKGISFRKWTAKEKDRAERLAKKQKKNKESLKKRSFQANRCAPFTAGVVSKQQAAGTKKIRGTDGKGVRRTK